MSICKRKKDKQLQSKKKNNSKTERQYKCTFVTTKHLELNKRESQEDQVRKRETARDKQWDINKEKKQQKLVCVHVL